MSLIENALEKLRRGEDGNTQPSVLGPRAVAPKGPAAIVAAEPKRDEPLRRLVINLKGLREGGYLPDEGLERRFADHYRQIKRPLIEKGLAGDADMRLIMVSSALPGDGKTFTSINLAFSMARERDVSVLLIDADAPRGRVTEVFGLRGEPGLLDALTDHSLDAESLIQHTDVRGLEILPAGVFVENATELLASARMGQIAALIAARNPRRIVVLDCAPLLVSSEARALTRIAGQIVLVARAGTTPCQAVTDALAHLDRGKLTGLVLNHAPFRGGGGYYYSGYGAKGKEPSDGG